MKALVYRGPKTLEYCDVTDASQAAGEELIAVHACGICGSDMHAFLGHDERRPAPLVLGHEAAGVIVGGQRDGLRVAINPLVTCQNCPACKAGRENLCPYRQIISMQPREGAFAQYVSMPSRNLVPVPDHVPLDIACMAEPLAVSWHTARLALEALHTSMEKDVVIIGGGAIGLAVGLALKAMGIDTIRIVEPNEKRRHYLNERCGVLAVTKWDEPAPLMVDAVGFSKTRKQASEQVAPGGVIAHIGLGDGEGGLDIRRMTLQEITFIGTYTYTAQDFRDTCAAMFDGRLGRLDWATARPLAEGSSAFAEILAGETAAPKTILIPEIVQ